MFDISQYEHSSIATKLGIDNSIPAEYTEHISELDALLTKAAMSWIEYCEKNLLGNPALVISSGYRCQEVNSHVGGAKDSPHTVGYAADLVPSNSRFEEFFKWALGWARSGVKFDEVLIEGIPGTQWVHIAVKSVDNEQRMKTMKYSQDGTLVQETLASYIPSSSTEMQYGTKATSDSNITSETIDWTDEDVFNMSPEEIDEYAAAQDADNSTSNGFLLTVGSGITEAEKRCLYIMKMLRYKISLSPSQAAGVVGNIAYMSGGTFSTFRNSGSTYGICQWDSKMRDVFNKLHYRTCLIEEATLKQQSEFLVYTMTEHLITKLQKCYDENSACDVFFSYYVKKSAWPDMFYGLSSKEEDKLRTEASSRRAYANEALRIWNEYNLIDVENVGNYIGTGQSGPRMNIGNDTKTYVSDGYISPVPENEREFTREYIEDEDYVPDQDLIDYYEALYKTMMGL